MSDLWERFKQEFGQMKSEEEAASAAEQKRRAGTSMDPLLRGVGDATQAGGDVFQWLTRPARAGIETYQGGIEHLTGVDPRTPDRNTKQLLAQGLDAATTGAQKAGQFVGANPNRDEAAAMVDIALGATPALKPAARALGRTRMGVAAKGAASRMARAGERALIEKAPAAIAEKLIKTPKLASKPTILDELRKSGTGVVAEAPKPAKPMWEHAQKFYDEAFDKNAPFDRLDKALGNPKDPGIGPGPGEGFGAEAAAAQGSLQNRTNALVQDGWFEQHRPFKSRGLPYHSMQEAVRKLGPEGVKDAGNFAVAQRELRRYHGAKGPKGEAKPLKAMMDEDMARQIVGEVEGNPQKHKAILDATKQYQGTVSYLADKMVEYRALTPKMREAWKKNPYFHLSRIMDPEFVKSTQRGPGAAPFSRVKGVTEDVVGTVNPLMTFPEVSQRMLKAIDRGRFTSQVYDSWKKNPKALAPYFEKMDRPVHRIKVHRDELAAELKRVGMSDDLIAEALDLDETLNVWRKKGRPMVEAGEFQALSPTGEEVWFKSTPRGQDMLDIVFNLDTADPGKILRTAELATGLFRAGVTQYNPSWWLYQLPADTLSAWSKTGQTNKLGVPKIDWYKNHRKGMGQGAYEAIKHVARPLFESEGKFSKWMKRSPDWDRYRSSGALAGTYSEANPLKPGSSLEKTAFTGDRGLIPDLVQAAQNRKLPGWARWYSGESLSPQAGGPLRRGLGRAKRAGGRLVMDPLHYIGEFGEISESMPRFGEQLGIRQMQGLTGQATDIPIPRAQQVQNQLAGARVTMPFQRGGSKVTQLNRFAFPFIKAFSNATLGEGKLMRHKPKQYVATRLGMAGLGAAAWLWNKDKESYKDAPDYEKGGYGSIYFDDPIDFGFGPVTALHLTAAREDMAMFKAMEWALQDVDELDPDAANRMALEYMKKYAYSLTDSFLPAPIYEHYLGKKLFGNQPINPPQTEGMGNYRPELSRWGTTPEFFDWINTSLGGFAGDPMTDAEVEHMADSLMGNAAMDTLGSLQRMAGVQDQPEGAWMFEDTEAPYTPEPRDATPLGRFFKRHSSSRNVRQFFDRYGKVADLVKLQRHLALSEDPVERWNSLNLMEADVRKKAAATTREYLVNLGRDYRRARTDEARLKIADMMRKQARWGLQMLGSIEGLEEKARSSGEPENE